ncbi:MAG: hypothetical protein ACK4OF_02985 [Aquificaceae bacterium]
MDNKIIEEAFKEGRTVRWLLYNAQGENFEKTIEKFSYRFLEGLRRQDSGELISSLIRLYYNLENRKIPEFFKELLKDISSMNQIGYAFLLGLNSYREVEGSREQHEEEG